MNEEVEKQTKINEDPVLESKAAAGEAKPLESQLRRLTKKKTLKVPKKSKTATLTTSSATSQNAASVVLGS